MFIDKFTSNLLLGFSSPLIIQHYFTDDKRVQATDDDDEVLPPYQDDHTALLRSRNEGAAVAMSPAGAVQTTRESKTTSRTYTDSEGNVITEVCML